MIDAKDATYSQLLLWIDENFYSEATSIATRIREGDVQTLAKRLEVSVVVLAIARTAPGTVPFSIFAQLTCSVRLGGTTFSKDFSMNYGLGIVERLEHGVEYLSHLVRQEEKEEVELRRPGLLPLQRPVR